MAISWANVKRIYRGPISIVYAEATLDDSYAAGGEVITATAIGLTTIKAAIPTATAGFDVSYSKTNDQSGKMVVYVSSQTSTSNDAAPVQSSTGRDLSTVVASWIFFGDSQ